VRPSCFVDWTVLICYSIQHDAQSDIGHAGRTVRTMGADVVEAHRQQNLEHKYTTSIRKVCDLCKHRNTDSVCVCARFHVMLMTAQVGYGLVQVGASDIVAGAEDCARYATHVDYAP
jgi:hypothetical protein